MSQFFCLSLCFTYCLLATVLLPFLYLSFLCFYTVWHCINTFTLLLLQICTLFPLTYCFKATIYKPVGQSVNALAIHSFLYLLSHLCWPLFFKLKAYCHFYIFHVIISVEVLLCYAGSFLAFATTNFFQAPILVSFVLYLSTAWHNGMSVILVIKRKVKHLVFNLLSKFLLAYKQ